MLIMQGVYVMGNTIGNSREFEANSNYGNITPPRRTRGLKAGIPKTSLNAADNILQNQVEKSPWNGLRVVPLQIPPLCTLVDKNYSCYENGTVKGDLIIREVNRVYLNNCKVTGEVIFLNSEGIRCKGKIFKTGYSSIEKHINTRKYATVKWYLDFRETRPEKIN